ILTIGKTPPNPSVVVQSRKLRELVVELKKRYDHIVFDSAPYGIITDAAPLIRLSDGIVLVCKFGDTRTDELGYCIENLNRVKANVIGIAINNYEYKKSTDYYSSSYYYNSYKQYEEYQKA
ncbi:MAG: capsular biosynthesis protein, partial [Balneolaceae bacterium]